MSKSEPEEMIEIEIDEREKQACLEEGWARWRQFEFRTLAHAAATHLQLFPLSSFACSVEEQTITASDLIQQDIDINEPIGNLKKLLEPRIQMSLDAYEICLQDIQVAMYTNGAYQDLFMVRSFCCRVFTSDSAYLLCSF